MLKEPYVLEFLGLDEKAGYSESDLETAIIDRLEQFLLELGKGFLFEARQKRFTFDEDHFFVDLVFYNRLLRCYVIIDLKLGQAQPPGSGADADVCELLRPLREDCPTRTPPSASSSAKKRKMPSLNSPCPRTPTSTPGNTSSTCHPRKCCGRNSSIGCGSRKRAYEAGDVFREVRPVRRGAQCGGEDAGADLAVGGAREAWSSRDGPRRCRPFALQNADLRKAVAPERNSES